MTSSSEPTFTCKQTERYCISPSCGSGMRGGEGGRGGSSLERSAATRARVGGREGGESRRPQSRPAGARRETEVGRGEPSQGNTRLGWRRSAGCDRWVGIRDSAAYRPPRRRRLAWPTPLLPPLNADASTHLCVSPLAHVDAQLHVLHHDVLQRLLPLAVAARRDDCAGQRGSTGEGRGSEGG